MISLGSYYKRRKVIRRVIFWSVIICGLLALLFARTIVNAIDVVASTPENPCSIGGCFTNINKYKTTSTQEGIVSLVLDIVSFLTYIGAGISVLFIVLGGYYMVASDGDDTKYKKGVNTLTYAVLGFVVTIISITIVSLISSIVPGLDITK